MMPALPRAAFKVIEANLFLELSVVHLDAPSTFGKTNKAAQSESLARHFCEPELGGRRPASRPFHQAIHGMIREAPVGRPAMSDPDLAAGESRFESATATCAPPNGLPTRGGQRSGHAVQIERLGQFLNRSALARSATAATRRNSRIGLLDPDLGRGFHLDTIRQVAGTQRFAKIGAVAITRIREDDSRPHSPAQDTIEASERQIIFRGVRDLLRNADLGPPIGIFDPICGQIEFPCQGRAATISAEMDGQVVLYQ